MIPSDDRVRRRIHLAAQRLAKDKSIPSARHAEAIVAQILREEHAAIPEDSSVSALAEELRRISRYSNGD